MPTKPHALRPRLNDPKAQGHPRHRIMQRRQIVTDVRPDQLEVDRQNAEK